MNKSHDYRLMKRQYVSGDMSLRELCRQHGISAHSVVVDQARKLRWAEKHEAYRAKASAVYIERHAARHADRVAEIEGKAIDVVDQALDRFSEDLAAKPVKQPDGSVIEEPVLRLKPRDVAILLDRLLVRFERPSRVSEGRGLNVRSQLPIEALTQVAELTRGRAAPPTSPLPRRRRLDD